ncbi:MAG: DNA cytosine methyltransferase [Alteromonadales bacterium]|nr:DNA cytosine methyltransferase [Alteromonadales bacterium]
MNVLSLFNGMSVGRMALNELKMPVTKYYSSEIDKHANKAAQALYPDTVQLGDVTQSREWDIDWASIDLVTGGFPCQAWSMAGKQLGDKDERGMLFWTMLDIMKHVRYHNPKAHFLIENVKMKKEFEQYITTHTENALGHVHKILINSALVSAQNRNRYYWTSFEVEQPEDKGLMLCDTLEVGVVDRDKAYCIDANYWKGTNIEQYIKKSRRQIAFTERRTEEAKRIRKEFMQKYGRDFSPRRAKELVARKDGKMNCLTATYSLKEHTILDEKVYYRKLTPRECMRLQTIPERHIDTLLNAGISNTQLYKMTGNGWTVDVIAHILSYLK